MSADELLAREFSNVRPLSRGHSIQPMKAVRPPPVRDLDAEGMEELADLVSGKIHFDFLASDERIEGAARGVDRQLVKQLRNGSFAVQAHIDLHGKTRAEAHIVVENFLAECRMRKHRCVLIVHGRGLNSKDQIPILKESLKLWLARGRISRAVLAFCSARPVDGGVGAVYVLLRK